MCLSGCESKSACFDESIFAMGVDATQNILTSAEYHGGRALLEAGNRKRVALIECIRASVSVLLLFFVFQSKPVLEVFTALYSLESERSSSYRVPERLE